MIFTTKQLSRELNKFEDDFLLCELEDKELIVETVTHKNIGADGIRTACILKLKEGEGLCLKR